MAAACDANRRRSGASENAVDYVRALARADDLADVAEPRHAQEEPGTVGDRAARADRVAECVDRSGARRQRGTRLLDRRERSALAGVALAGSVEELLRESASQRSDD